MVTKFGELIWIALQIVTCWESTNFGEFMGSFLENLWFSSKDIGKKQRCFKETRCQEDMEMTERQGCIGKT